MEYAQMVCGHLSAYRENVLGIARAGVFQYRGRSVGLPHILPIELRRENILADFRERFFASQYDEAHRMKFRQTYLPLVGRPPYLADACRDEAFCLRHYPDQCAISFTSVRNPASRCFS